MRIRLFRALVFAVISPTFLAAPGVAFAQDAVTPAPAPGTEDGARALQESLSAYLTKAAFNSGIVKIQPDPKGYRLTFKVDAQLDAEKMGGVSGSVSVKPHSIVVAERPDGNWSVRSDSPLSAGYDITVDGQKNTAAYEVGPFFYEGVYSPSLGSFLSTTGTAAETTVTQTDALTRSTASIGAQTFDMKATQVGEGAVDMTYSQTGKAYSQSASIAMDPTKPDERMTIDVTADGVDLAASGKALKSRPMLDLYAFVLAHPSQEQLVAAQAELKDRLRALLPVWDAFEGRYAFNGIRIGSPFGILGATTGTADFSGDGVESDGRYRYTFGFEGLTIDSPMVPAWATSLIPKDMSFVTAVEGVDLATPARIAIDDFDLARDQPVSDEAGAEALAALSADLPKVVFEPSTIKAADYEIAISGDMTFGGIAPEVKLDITASGLDKAIRTLQEAGATDQRALQIVGPLSMATGFAKALGDGRSQWVIETAADGSVKINGMQIKGPDAPPPIPDIAPTDENAIPPL